MPSISFLACSICANATILQCLCYKNASLSKVQMLQHLMQMFHADYVLSKTAQSGFVLEGVREDNTATWKCDRRLGSVSSFGVGGPPCQDPGLATIVQ